ncbi:radical SAM protein [bacterium]|nr:radical SAM protein [bacterium]
MSQLALSDARARQRRAAEETRFAKKQDAPRRVCLAYANRYPVAMGNLGFQVVYELFDRAAGVVCERAFLPDEDEVVGRGALRTLESGRRVADCDLLAFSIAFETDYLNLIRMLELAGLPPRRDARGPEHPLVIAGGPAIFLNPEPIADFVDCFLVGEGEEMVPEFVATWSGSDAADRGALLAAIAERVAGAYVPAHFAPRHDGEALVALEHDGPGPGRVQRRLIWDLNRFATTTRVLSDEAVFGDMVLVEASRGCQWGCRFCAAGYMYRPIRSRDPEHLAAEVAAGLDARRTVGLVGAEMASVPGVDRLAELAAARDGRLSPSSLKADCVTPRLAAALAAGGARSVTVAPEAGSERMRRVINKNLSEADILRAADLMAGEGVQQLKLYFMIGLPTESEDDVLAIAGLAERIRARLTDGARRRRVGSVTISLNAFVPKPWTPFQWDPMESIASLRGKGQRLRQAARRIPNLTLDIESPRAAYLQTILSRGDRRVARFLEATHAADGDWWRVIRAWQRDGLDGAPHPDAYVHRAYGEDELLPWDFIDHRIAKSYLWVERRKAFAARQTAPCDTSTCRSCAAC